MTQQSLILLVLMALLVLGIANLVGLVWLARRGRYQAVAMQQLVADWGWELQSWLYVDAQARQPGYLPFSKWSLSARTVVEVLNRIAFGRPRLIVEFGSGASTIAIAQTLAAAGHGRLVSFEHDAAWVDRVRATLERRGLSSYATVVHAPLRPWSEGQGSGHSGVWYAVDAVLDAIGQHEVDLMIVDGPPKSAATRARYPALPTLAPRLSARAVVFLDDANRVDERAIVERWTAEFGWSARFVGGLYGHCVLERNPGGDVAATASGTDGHD